MVDWKWQIDENVLDKVAAGILVTLYISSILSIVVSPIHIETVRRDIPYAEATKTLRLPRRHKRKTGFEIFLLSGKIENFK